MRHRLPRRAPASLNGRHQAERNARHERHGDRERKHPAVQVHLIQSRDATGRRDCEERADTHLRDHDAQRSAGQPNDAALGE